MGYRIMATDCDGYGEISWIGVLDTLEEAEAWVKRLYEDEQDTELRGIHIEEYGD